MNKEPEIRAEEIKKFREKKRLTQQQLASALNVSVTTVSRWESGLKEPSGSAAAILKSLIAGSLGGGLLGGIEEPGLSPLLTSGRSIYQLLKETFEGK
jgi:transcriptional regulator with XRE-family HTH domain